MPSPFGSRRAGSPSLLRQSRARITEMPIDGMDNMDGIDADNERQGDTPPRLRNKRPVADAAGAPRQSDACPRDAPKNEERCMRSCEPAKIKVSRRPLFEMRNDLRRRAPHYVSDWRDGCHPKVLSAALFMFFTSIAPAITFAAVLSTETLDKDTGISQLGPVEVIFSTALTGIMFSVFGGQPLCIVGVTGPVTIFTISVYKIADALKLEFMPFYACIQLWAALMHMLLAAFNACELIKLVTRYSCETFGMLIAVIYLYTGIGDLIYYFIAKSMDVALLSLLLGLGTATTALALTGFASSSLFTRRVRSLIADYGATIAVVFFCFVPYMGRIHYLTPDAAGKQTNMTINTLQVPDEFGTTSGREWFVNPFDCPAWGVFVAIIPAAVLTVLFFFDHNVSSLLCQQPEFGLLKGTAYHWDFFVVGVQILVTGLLGVPPVNGLIPQAPLHTESLCEKRYVMVNCGKECKQEVRIVKCHEQRVSNFGQAILIGLTLAAIKVVGYMPIATLDGLFIYMGIASFGGNTFYNRLVLFITDKSQVSARGLDKALEKVPLNEVHRYTLLQLVILVVIFAVTRAPFIDGLFPLFIALLVPMRLYLLPRWFGADNVNVLDAEGEKPPPPEDDNDSEANTPAGAALSGVPPLNSGASDV